MFQVTAYSKSLLATLYYDSQLFCTVFNAEFEKLCGYLLLFYFNTFVNKDFKQILTLYFYLMMLDGFLTKYCIYSFLL